jgi:ATP-dependent protease HslVU (ClpYQ) peptidase subunit
MTTVIYNHKEKQIACDSRLTAGTLIVSDTIEKFKSNKKGMWFFAGAKSDESQIMELEHNDKPGVKPDCCALLVKNKKCYLVAFNDHYCSITENEYNESIGSGGEFALAALDFHASTETAVEYAITKDSASGGEVHVYDIEKGKFI